MRYIHFQNGMSKSTWKGECQMEKYIKEISDIQNTYYDILRSHQYLFEETDNFSYEAMLLVEELKRLWAERLSNISLILDSLTNTGNSVLLCGAIYLDVKENEEFIFSTFGPHHFLNDPLLKMEPFLLGQSGHATADAKDYFKNVYIDTLQTLSSFSNEITFLPFYQIYSSQIKDTRQTINNGYWGVISSLLKGSYSSINDIKKSFSDINSIEKGLTHESLRNLIFIDRSDAETGLLQRIDRYFSENSNMLPMDCDDEIAKFVISTFGQIAQVLELLLMCLFFNVIPFLRNEITFHYLMLLSGSFMKHKEISSVINKTIIIYLFYYSVDRHKFDNLNFTEYSQKMREYDLLGKIYSELNCNDDSFFKNNVNDIVDIIQDQFQKALSSI
jgi:hypothetical protein